MINPVYGNTVYFLFRNGDSPPLKHPSSVNVSKSSQMTVVYKVLISKSVNSFVPYKPGNL